MKKHLVILNIFMLCLTFNMFGQQHNYPINIKTQRTYLEGKLINEDYYDQQGRLVKTSIPDYKSQRNESIGGKLYSLSFEYDTLASFFEYSENEPQKKSYSYYVKDTIKSELELEAEYYYKNGLLKKIRYNDKYINTERYKYNKQGHLIKESSNIFNQSRYKYVYISDTLIVKKTRYDNFRINYNSCIIYVYNRFKQKEKSYIFDFHKKLTEITLYSYDEKHRLIKTEEIDLFPYTVIHQRIYLKHITLYNYNDYDLIIEKHILDDNFNKTSVRETIYQYEYEYY